MMVLSKAARAVADLLGRDSWVIRGLRPVYDVVLDWATGGRGLPWEINGITYRLDPRHRYLTGGPYEAPLATWLAGRVRPGQTVLDVGANIGIYVLRFAHWTRPDGRIIAVEPNPAARAVLEKHVRLNQLESRVEIVPAAVGATAGEALLYALDADMMSRIGAPNPALAERATTIPVPVVTLDQLCQVRQVKPDWLFLDIEGFEIAALTSAHGLLADRSHRPDVVVEMHPDSWEIAGTSRSTAETLFRELGLVPEPLSGQQDPLGVYGHVWLRPA